MPEIYRVIDEHGLIVVSEYTTHRWMYFDKSDLLQGHVHLNEPLRVEAEYLREMLMPLRLSTPQHVTVLGVGAGTLISYLHAKYPDVPVVAVDTRQAVIDVAYDYLYLPRVPSVTLVCADAIAWLKEQPDNSTDLLLCDLALSEGTLPECDTHAFHLECSRVLRPGGWLSMNRFTKEKNRECVSSLGLVFSSVCIVQVPGGNTVFAACNGATP